MDPYCWFVCSIATAAVLLREFVKAVKRYLCFTRVQSLFVNFKMIFFYTECKAFRNIETALKEFRESSQKGNIKDRKLIDQTVNLIERKLNLAGDAVWWFGWRLLCSGDRYVECVPVFAAASRLVMKKASIWKSTNEEGRRALSIAQWCAWGMYQVISKIIKSDCKSKDVVPHDIIPLILKIRDDMAKATSVHKKQRSVAAVRVMLYAGRSAAEVNDLKRALEIYQDGIARLDRLFRKNKKPKVYCFIREQMGNVFEVQSHLKDAVLCFREAIYVHKSLQNYGTIFLISVIWDVRDHFRYFCSSSTVPAAFFQCDGETFSIETVQIQFGRAVQIFLAMKSF